MCDIFRAGKFLWSGRFRPKIVRRSGPTGENTVGTAEPISTPPASEYERRRADRAVSAIQLEGRERVAGRLRIALFLILVGLFLAVPVSDAWFIGPACVVAAGFVAAVAWHRRVVAALGRARKATAYYTRALDRLNDRWAGRGPAGERYGDPAHPYAGDLDLFGRGSLYQYLCEAHTPVGKDTLAEWLCKPAEPDVVRSRQEAVAELRDDVDLREELAVLGDPEQPDLKTRELLTWPAAPPVLVGRAGPIVAVILGSLGLAGVVLWVGFGTGPAPLLAVAIVELIFVAGLWHRIREVTRDSRAVLAELTAFLPVLRLVESSHFSSPMLRSLRESLAADGSSPSARVARLAALLDAWDSAMRNQLLLPAAFVLMVPAHLVYSIERWRLRDGRHVRQWLDAVATFEAASSLSAFAYGHPDYAIPDVVPDGPLFEAKGLGHPLIPATLRVGNDIRLGREPALLLVSGSNMSGKSTLMRAVGVNVVLALAGSVVCARRLRVSPLAVATAMRQGDSLQEGVSAFYAEIRRLQAIREWAAVSRPLLFLLDEILRGTNSHDRRVGAEAVIDALLQRGAIGMVSTHDLALAEIVDRLGPRAANVHFEDELTDGQVRFDYRLRPGIVPRGNGLVLLRLLGFDV